MEEKQCLENSFSELKKIPNLQMKKPHHVKRKINEKVSIPRCKLVKLWISKIKNIIDFQEEKDYQQNQTSPKCQSNRIWWDSICSMLRGKAVSDLIILY